MCGIIGSIGFNNLQKVEMLDSIYHRGPDSNGDFQDEDTYLGHTRLAIQDLSENGRQPMVSADGRYVIIFNGEIYNHQILRDKLKNKYDFTSTSDTQTLLYGYIEFGPEVLNMMNGIFAFAIYDSLKKNIFIVRDQLGIKPLYYYFKDSILLFGSEIKSFLTVPELDRSIDHKALVNYLTLLWSPGEQTAFNSVKKLLPGHYISYDINKPDSFEIKKYYDIPFTGLYSEESESDLIAQLDKKLYLAVERQLLSDVPVAFFLSGGLDSSAIVAIAKKIRPLERLRCYTIKTLSDLEDEGFSDDLYFARLVAKHLDLDLVEVESEIDFVDDFDKMVYHLDEPQSDSAPLNVLNICKRAREDGYTVLLGGTAGDDLFSGYRRHQAIVYEKYFQGIPSIFKSILKIIVSWITPVKPIFRRIRKLTNNIDLPKKDRMYGYFEWLPLENVKSLFSEKIKREILNYNPKNIFFELLKNIPREKNDLNQMLYWEMKTFLVDHNLNYTDKLSMAVGVEVRVPFLDIDLVEFSTRIPPHLKMKGKETKYILKKLMEKYLPNDIIYREKTGFGTPIRKLVVNDLDDKINTYLSDEAILNRAIFDPHMVRCLINDNKAGKIDASYTIWALLSIESWFRQFVDLKALGK